MAVTLFPSYANALRLAVQQSHAGEKQHEGTQQHQQSTSKKVSYGEATAVSTQQYSSTEARQRFRSAAGVCQAVSNGCSCHVATYEVSHCPVCDLISAGKAAAIWARHGATDIIAGRNSDVTISSSLGTSKHSSW